MADIIPSLFGLTPEMYGQQQQMAALNQGVQLSNMSPEARGAAMTYAGAAGLGRAVGGLLGAEDPQLRMITQQQEIMRGLDITNPVALTQAAQKASQLGNQDLALRLLTTADQMTQRQAQIQAQQEALQARQISQQAFQPGQPTMYGQPTQFPLKDDEGNVMPGAGVSGPSYDIKRVEAQLLQTPAGRAELESIYKAQEAAAKTNKLAAEAVSAQAKADVASPTERAELLKKSADATKAVIESQFTQRAQELGLQEKTWNIKNLQSEIGTRGAKLNLDTQMTNVNVLEKLAQINKLNTEIPADTRKLINENAVVAATAKQSADQFNDLANRIESLGGYGKLSSLSEFAKSTIGAEGYETSLRQEYTRLRNSAAIKALPPGPATDKDIQMALSGFPKDTSNSANIAQFLRGMAKLQDIDSAVANAKTDWLAKNNGALTRAGSTFIAGDFTVRPGESFNDFSSRVAKDVNDRYSGASREGQRQALVNQIPTPNRPTPNAQTSNIMSAADAILRGGR
jgi:hypothetical protein